MEHLLKEGDRVFIKSQGDCIRATVLQVDEKEVTVKLEEISHTPVIAKYSIDHLSLCNEEETAKHTRLTSNPNTV